jgi:C1A family cysteine protease
LTGNCAAGFSCTNGICTSINIPRSYDWRNISGKNYMTPVRNQGGCGSCWAFAAVGAVEANINAYYNKNLNIDLSEQDLVSCSKAGTCAGGALSTVLNYISSNGVCQETCFKYTATNSNCSLKCSTSQDNLWKISPAVSITNNVPEITKALYGKGPLATYIGIYSDFYSYSSGIYNKSPTATYQGGHYVDIVGYGTYNGQPYYICRNSWGTGWGQGGYFKIYAGVASIGSQTKYIPNPIPPASSPQTVLCEDLDNDGYCNWGIGSKPNSCPVCSSVKDCDDINANIQSDCTQMG